MSGNNFNSSKLMCVHALVAHTGGAMGISEKLESMNAALLMVGNDYSDVLLPAATKIADLTAKLAEGERERDQIIDEADSLRAEVERLNREIVKACDSHCQRTLCEMQRSLDESEARLRDLRVTIEWAHHGMEIARIWGGMEWHWNHLASFRAKAIWERLDAALAKSAVTLP